MATSRERPDRRKAAARPGEAGGRGSAEGRVPRKARSRKGASLPDRVRTRHDEWGKRALSLWFEGLGDVQVDARVAGESRRGDVLYTERRGDPARRRTLGVLGELARGRVLFELFRNPPTTIDLKACVLKGVDLEAREIRAARRAGEPLSGVEGPALCVILPTMSAELRASAGAERPAGMIEGLYALAPMWRAMLVVLVVVHELPAVASTLWLRLLGRGRVQARAARELLEMGEREPLKDATVQLLIAWQQSLPLPEEQSEEEREQRMNWEQVYQRWEKKVKAQARIEGKIEGKVEGKAEGLAEGEAKGKAEAVLAFLESRGLPVTAAERKTVLACTDDAQLDAWIRAAATAPSAEAVLAQRPARRRAPSGSRTGTKQRRPVARSRASHR